MGYNIDISLNVFKICDIDSLKEKIINIAIDNNCEDYYYEYEFELHYNFQRNHCVITVNFCDNIIYFVSFLSKLKSIQNISIEVIYKDNPINIIHASNYYCNKMMDKILAQNYRLNRRERSYSEDETSILRQL